MKENKTLIEMYQKLDTRRKLLVKIGVAVLLASIGCGILQGCFL